MEHWWNDSDGGKQKYSELNLSQCHLAHHKSNMNRPDIYCATYEREEIVTSAGLLLQSNRTGNERATSNRGAFVSLFS
jgi:hypothetical protein